MIISNLNILLRVYLDHTPTEVPGVLPVIVIFGLWECPSTAIPLLWEYFL